MGPDTQLRSLDALLGIRVQDGGHEVLVRLLWRGVGASQALVSKSGKVGCGPEPMTADIVQHMLTNLACLPL